VNLISEKTSIPIGIALSVIGGAAAWMTSLAIHTNANAKSLEIIEQRLLKYTESIQTIERDIAVIKTKAELIEQRSRGK
jgi:hypothetical protein